MNLAEVSRVFPPEELERFQKAVGAAINADEPYSMDYKIIRPDGAVRHIHDEGEVVRDEQGKAIWMHGTTQDITERKQAEEALRTFSTRLEAILASVPDIIIEVDENKVYTWANPAGLAFFGEDVISKEAAFYFIGEQDTYSEVKPLFESSENVIYIESWQRRKDGEKRLLAWQCRVLKDTDGNVVGALSSAHDITERKRAEEAMERERRDFQTILDIAPVMIAYKSKDDHFIRVNSAFSEFVGLAKEKIIGMTTFDLVKQRDVAQQGRDDDLEVIRTGKPVLNQLVKWSGFSSQKEIWANYTKLPFHDSDGSIIGTLFWQM